MSEKALDRLRKFSSRVRQDGFVNSITGLGTSRDKSIASVFEASDQLTPEALDTLYSQNDTAARICDVVPEEELRQGFELIIHADDSDDSAVDTIESVMSAVDELQMCAKTVEARVWGRVFGGGAMILGVDDGQDPKEPLAKDRIKSFTHINVVDRQFMAPETVQDDPSQPGLGDVLTYRITGQAQSAYGVGSAPTAGVVVHASRMIVFGGVRTTVRTKQRNDRWDTSILQQVDDVLTQYGVAWQMLDHLMQDASQAVFKMKDVVEAIASNQPHLVMSRVSVMDTIRSNVRALVLDEEESFERNAYDWKGVKEPYELLMLRLSSAARMPVTVMMGQSPAGMDATGESDMRWFNDTVSASQEQVVKPALMRMLELLMRAKDGPTKGVVPDSWTVRFPPLEEPSALEQSQIELNTAQKDQIYFGMGAITAEEVALSRWTADGFSTTTVIDRSLREALSIPAEDDTQDDG